MNQLLEEAPLSILSFEAVRARDEIEATLERLPCMEGIITPETLGRLWFVLGVSHLYAADELGQDPQTTEASARAAFELAHQADPTLAWTVDLYGDYGESLWNEATSAWDAAVGAAKVGAPAKGYWVEVEAEGWPPGGVYVDGRLAEELGDPPTLHRGRHLLQYRTTEGLKGAWVVISPGQVVVTLPLPNTLPTLGPGALGGQGAGAIPQSPPPEAPAQEGTSAEIDIKATKATPKAPPQAPLPAPMAAASDIPAPSPSPAGLPPQESIAPIAAPPSTSRGLQTELGIFIPTWRLPQLYSGPEVQLRVNPTRRLVIALGLGSAIGAWTSCDGCEPRVPGELSVIFPVRGEVALRLGRGPVEVDLGVAWQGYFGGGFGDTATAPSASAHGYEGTATLLVGDGPWRGALRLGGGRLIAPEALALPQGSAAIGITRQFGS